MSDVVVVDTNVPLVANRMAPQVSPACVIECVRALQEVTSGRQRLALDDGRRIIREYGHQLSDQGQPGVGDAFYKWVLTNYANPTRCELVAIHPREEDDRDFDEFPRTDELADFDPADRKFVAVAAAHPDRPPILQAADRKWWREWKPGLEAAGINVTFLCPMDLEAPAPERPPRRNQGRRG